MPLDLFADPPPDRLLLGLGQTFAIFFSKVARGGRKSKSSKKVAALEEPVARKYRKNPLRATQADERTCGLSPLFGSGFGEVFFMSPNLASCERVFALLKNMFGEQQVLSALNDYIQGALMVRYLYT